VDDLVIYAKVRSFEPAKAEEFQGQEIPAVPACLYACTHAQMSRQVEIIMPSVVDRNSGKGLKTKDPFNRFFQDNLGKPVPER